MSTRVMFTMVMLTVREALNTRLTWAALACAVVVVVLAQFGAAVSLAEADSTRTALAAALLRLGYVVLLTLFIASSMDREAQDKWLEVLLSLPLRRWQLLAARLMGYAVVALMLASVSGLLLAFFAPFSRVLAWTGAFIGELLIVSAFTVFCMSSLRNLTLSVCAVLAFYLFCRTVTAMQLIAHAPIVETGLLSVLVQNAIDVLALVLPRLDQFSNAAWLVGDSPVIAGTAIALQTLVYVVLLGLATLFDLHRRNF